MLVLVAFSDNDHNGRCTGDSAYSFDSCGNYVKGMTFEQARTKFIAHIRKEWNIDEEQADEEFFEECFGDEEGPTGFWVVDKKIYNIITNIDADWGNDSALYAGMHTIKSQLDNAAEKVLEG